MSDYKISGHCTVCDAPCFEVIQTWSDGERYPGEPKRLGKPLQGAMRISFVLLDGTKADMTFCGDCAQSLNPGEYTGIWRKVMRSWQRELDKDHPGEARPEWYDRSFTNALLAEMGRTSWESMNGA